ncbi:hypothetical protein LCGC14_2407350 [marine sediment metagenome]|uniref:Uncharacterized protein n=1 Tax=marine sediment metagenome TaxID=412755 RepID=A0A0F9EN18_9ZZZZ
MRKLVNRRGGRIHVQAPGYLDSTLCGRYILGSPGVGSDVPVTRLTCKRVLAANTKDTGGGSE